MKIKLKQKPKRLTLKKNTDENKYDVNKQDVSAVLVKLLEECEKQKKPVPLDKWLELGKNLPPYTNQLIVISRPKFNTAEIHVSYVFLQHYLINKYYYTGFEDARYFMLLSEAPK